MSKKGLINNGATCYLNSAIQAIYASNSAKTAIMQMPQDKILHEKIMSLIDDFPEGSNPEKLLVAFQQLLLRMDISSKQYLSTKILCRAMGMSDFDLREQQDANELLKRILDKCETACKKYDKDNDAQSLKYFQKTFEGHDEQIIACNSCNNESITVYPYTDVILPVTPNLFDSLAKLIQGEDLDGYSCTKCNQSTQAIKYKHIKDVPQLLQMTVQRFGYNMVTGQMAKDSAPVMFPLYIDIKFIGYISLKMGQVTEKQISQYAAAIMMPWLYYTIIEDQITAKQQQDDVDVEELLQNQEFVYHLKQYYKNVELKNCFLTNEEPSQAMLQPILQGQIPESLYRLCSVVCHTGTLDGGHYYTIALKHNDSRTSMFKCNDTLVSAVENPINILQFISGITQTLCQDKDETSQKQEHSIISTNGYGNTGFMYFYERANEVEIDLKKLCKVEQLVTEIENDNKIENERFFLKQIKIITNYRKDESTINQFSEREGDKNEPKQVQLSFNISRPCRDLIEEAKKAFGIRNEFTCDKVVLHQCEYYNAKRELILSEHCELLSDSLDDAYNRLCIDKPYQMVLFLEFVVGEQFNYQHKYILATSIKLETKIDDSIKNCQIIDNDSKIVYTDSKLLQLDVDIPFNELQNLYQTMPQQAKANITNNNNNSGCVNCASLKIALAQKLKVGPQQIILYTTENSQNKVKLVNSYWNDYFNMDWESSLHIDESKNVFYEIVDLETQLAGDKEQYISSIKKSSKLAQITLENNQISKLIQLCLLNDKNNQLNKNNISHYVTQNMNINDLLSQLKKITNANNVNVMQKQYYNYDILLSLDCTNEKSLTSFQKMFDQITIGDIINKTGGDEIFIQISTIKLINYKVTISMMGNVILEAQQHITSEITMSKFKDQITRGVQYEMRHKLMQCAKLQFFVQNIQVNDTDNECQLEVFLQQNQLENINLLEVKLMNNEMEVRLFMNNEKILQYSTMLECKQLQAKEIIKNLVDKTYLNQADDKQQYQFLVSYNCDLNDIQSFIGATYEYQLQQKCIVVIDKLCEFQQFYMEFFQKEMLGKELKILQITIPNALLCRLQVFDDLSVQEFEECCQVYYEKTAKLIKRPNYGQPTGFPQQYKLIKAINENIVLEIQ